MSYTVNGRQYIAVGTGNNMNVMTGRGKLPTDPDFVPATNGGGMLGQLLEMVSDVPLPATHNAMYVFALDDGR